MQSSHDSGDTVQAVCMVILDVFSGILGCETSLAQSSNRCLMICVDLILDLLDLILGSLLNVLKQLLLIGNASAIQEFVSHDQLGLHICQNCIQLFVDVNQSALPNVVAHRVILRHQNVLFEQLGIGIGQHKVNRCAVLHCLEHGVAEVALHIQGSASKLYITVHDHTHEGHCVALKVITAGVQRHIQNVICIVPGVCIGGIQHNAVVLLEMRQRIQHIFLGFLAQDRLFLIKIRVQRIAEGCQRNALCVLKLRVLLTQLFIEIAICFRRQDHLIIAHKALLGSGIDTSCRIAIFNGTGSIFLHIELAATIRLGGKHKVKIRINAKALFCRISGQLLES